jgi:hypothetical protein
MGERELRADCNRCVGLCCVAFAFDRGPAFAFDKAADVPCKNLLPVMNRCAIHERREERGFDGCVGYDCLGAGQRVTALFDGRKRDAAMLQAFRRMHEVHHVLSLLHEARKLDLDPARAARCEALLERVDRAEEPVETFTGEVYAFLRTLRDVSPRASSAPG